MTGRLSPAGPPTVLHFIRPEAGDSVGGADLHVLDLAAAQSAAGRWAPTVVALEAPDHYHRRACSLGLRLVDPVRGGRWGLPARLTALAQRRRAALVHSHGYEADYLAALLRRLHPTWRRLPPVMTCHGLVYGSLRHRVMSLLDLRSMRAADAVVCVASVAARDLSTKLPVTTVHLVANGVPPPASPPDPATVGRVRDELGAGPGQPLVAYVGRLSPEKRPDLFIATARELARRCPAARFTLIGGGMLAEKARLLVRQAGLDDRCVVAGVRHDMEDVYGAIDLLLLCSETEGTPRVILEAQARRVPVVARAVGDVPCLVRDGRSGILVASSDPCTLADAAWRLLSDPLLRSAVANAAVDSVLREYTVERMAEEIDCVYRELRPSAQG